MRDIDPDSEENQEVSRQNDREIFALQMQARKEAAEENRRSQGRKRWLSECATVNRRINQR